MMTISENGAMQRRRRSPARDLGLIFACVIGTALLTWPHGDQSSSANSQGFSTPSLGLARFHSAASRKQLPEDTKARIVSVIGREVMDSRGNLTVEALITRGMVQFLLSCLVVLRQRFMRHWSCAMLMPNATRENVH